MGAKATKAVAALELDLEAGEVARKDVVAIFDLFDKDGSGVLEKKEADAFFTAWLKSQGVKDKGAIESKRAELWKIFDVDGDGAISKSEITGVARKQAASTQPEKGNGVKGDWFAEIPGLSSAPESVAEAVKASSDWYFKKFSHSWDRLRDKHAEGTDERAHIEKAYELGLELQKVALESLAPALDFDSKTEENVASVFYPAAETTLRHEPFSAEADSEYVHKLKIYHDWLWQLKGMDQFDPSKFSDVKIPEWEVLEDS